MTEQAHKTLELIVSLMGWTIIAALLLWGWSDAR